MESNVVALPGPRRASSKAPNRLAARPARGERPLSWRMSLLVWAVLAAAAWGLVALALQFA